MSMMKEFREFTARGNVIDLAVGVIIGAAFGKIVTSFVDDIVMPPIGLALGGVGRNRLIECSTRKIANATIRKLTIALMNMP